MTAAIVAAKEWAVNVIGEKVSSQKRLRVLEDQTNAEVYVRTDAAWRSEDKAAGLGWTIQDTRQRASFKGYQKRVNSALLAESLALREALLMCKEMEVTNLRVESDSSVLIKAARGTEPVAELHGVISDIRLLSSSFQSISFGWISRDQNGVADKLAKDVLYVGDTFMAPT